MPDTTATSPTSITATTPMRDVLEQFPGAQRALFARYHIGGCQSCGFQPTESVADVCARNENLPVDEVINHIVDSHTEDARILLPPEQLKELLGGATPPRLVDLRTREEYEAVKISGAILFSQDLLSTIFADWPKDDLVVFYDHTGTRSLDAAAYLIGHGYTEIKCLEGGIDAYAEKADPSLARYKIEFED